MKNNVSGRPSRTKRLPVFVLWLTALAVIVQPMCAVAAFAAPPGGGHSTTQVVTSDQVSTLLSSGNLNLAGGKTLVIEFNSSGGLTIPGNLVNGGNIYAVTSNPAVRTATITANNILN